MVKGLTQSEQTLMKGSSVQSETALSDGAKNLSAKDDLNNERKKRASAVRHTTAEEKSYPVIPSREKFNKFTLCVKTYCRKNYL